MNRPASTHDLLPSERRFIDALRSIGYGRLERIRVSAGELVLSPPPLSVRTVKFGSTGEPAVGVCPKETICRVLRAGPRDR